MTCTGNAVKEKTLTSVLDYKFDWAALTNGSGESDWLESGETISSFTIVAPSGITVDQSAKADTDTSVVMWLSGGTAIGSVYDIDCNIVTDSSPAREETMTMTVIIVEKKNG